MKPIAIALLGLALFGTAYGTSHREAPGITKLPKLDSTDFYMFRSYETGREAYATIVANYQPLQEPGGGPSYFFLDDEAIYEIHIDNDGNGVEDMTFQFKFSNDFKDLTFPVGPDGDKTDVEVALLALGPFGENDTSLLGLTENYTLTLITGDRRTGQKTLLTHDNGNSTFTKPADNFGSKSIPDYEAYARKHVFEFNIPGCSLPGRVFVGQRKDPFVIALGDVFDLISLNPLGPESGNRDTFECYNVTSICLELPIECLVDNDPVVGAWTSASKRQVRVLNPAPRKNQTDAQVEGGAWTQVSRLSGPLFNELLVGYRTKDRFNASEPKDDAQFERFVDRPTLPSIIEALFPGVTAPTLFPREDLRQGFLTGVPGLNRPANVTPAEMLRLNTSVPVTPFADQKRLGVLESDLSGFPNGRRPGDDIVDIVLRVAMGALLPADVAPSGQLPFTDGTFTDKNTVDQVFPYLKTPLAGNKE